MRWRAGGGGRVGDVEGGGGGGVMTELEYRTSTGEDHPNVCRDVMNNVMNY